MQQRVHACCRDVFISRQVSFGVKRGRRVTSFTPAGGHVVFKGINAGAGHIRVAGEVAIRIEIGVGIAVFRAAADFIMGPRIDPRETDVRIEQ